MKVRLWRQEATLTRTVRAAGQLHDVRHRLFLEIDCDGVTGFGEVAPQPTALNGDPGVQDVLVEVCDVVLPQLRQIVHREGALPAWSRVARFAGPRPPSGPAIGLVEMALLDRELRASTSSIEELWTPIYDTPVQMTVSLIDDLEWVVDPNISRLRVKTRPGRPSNKGIERLARLEVPILLDFNCSATCDADVVDQVRRISSVVQVDGVEQPFEPGNVIAHAQLAQQLDVAVSIDEGVRSARDIDQIERYRAASIVCVKPARVGGLANARTIIARARDAGLRPYIGGFFESPYARHVHQSLARSSVDEPSDLLAVQVEPDGPGAEICYQSGGFGVVPDPQMLQRLQRVTLFE